MSVSNCSPVTPSTPLFPNISFTKTIRNLPLVSNYLLPSMKNGYSNLYFHLYTFDQRQKLFSYLTPLSLRCPVSQSTSTFHYISQTETIKNLIFAWKLNQKWLKESLHKK